ncbi:DUF3068 domain-containing protein [Streptosporangium oxazolinicum]|uniref:DUF3068 domain-containing protein n=1 Tax=Streptosporangium oxazolinicum TaxID=909287 RepID=UPI0031E63365
MIDRRLHGVVAIAVGAFLVTLAALVRLHVYPGAMLLPAEQDRVTRMSSESGTYFDTAALRTRRGVPIDVAVARYGDLVRSTADVAVWTEFVSVQTRTGGRIDYHERRAAFDRRTGQAVDCCDGYNDIDPRPRPRGLVFRWPLDARPISYPVYDPLARRAVTARFEAIETLYGVRVHRYAQRLVNERLQQPAMNLPGTVLGLDRPEEVPAVAYLDGTRTFWVEPASGMVIGVRENLTKTLRTADGRGRLVLFSADLRTSSGDERWNAGEAGHFRSWSLVVGVVVPLSLALPGLAALLLGLRRQLRPDGPDPAPDPVPGPDLDPAPDPDPGPDSDPGPGSGPGEAAGTAAGRDPRPADA